MPSPLGLIPQPSGCGKAITPSTFGKAASRYAVKCLAIARVTVAEQFTDEITAM